MKKITALLLALAVIVSFGTAAFATEGENEFNEIIGAGTETAEKTADILKDVAYLNDDNVDHLMDLFGTQTAQEPMPVIVEVHGGGYIGGNKEINTDHAVFYAENGYLVVAPNYTHLPQGAFRTAEQDLFACYRWIAEHAEEYHFDLDHVAISGDSAGGYYVLMTAALMSSESLREYFDVELPGFDFSAYILTCPGTDVVAIKDGLGQSGPAGFMAGRIGEEILFNEDLMSHCDLYSVIDPETYPYVYMITTPGDVTTGAETLKFDAFLTEKGIAHELHSYEDEGSGLIHVFNILKMQYPESIKANNDIITYLDGICK